MTHSLILAPTPGRRPRGRGGLLRRAVRIGVMALGGLLVLAGIIIAPLPGPLGLPVAVLGLVLILRNSWWAKRQFIRAQRARPNFIYPFRRLMRKKPEVAPVFWHQALRVERLVLKRANRFLIRVRRRARDRVRQRAHAL